MPIPVTCINSHTAHGCRWQADLWGEEMKFEELNSEAYIDAVSGALGVDRFLEFGTIRTLSAEVQYGALMAFAAWCRESGNPNERVSWSDVATNAELCALSVGAEVCIDPKAVARCIAESSEVAK